MRDSTFVIEKKKTYRVEHDDELVNSSFVFSGPGDEEDGNNLLLFNVLIEHKGLNIEHISNYLTIKEVKKLVKFLSESVKEYEEWDWENGCTLAETKERGGKKWFELVK